MATSCRPLGTKVSTFGLSPKVKKSSDRREPVPYRPKHRKNMNSSNNQWVLLHHQVSGPISDRDDHFDFMLSPMDSALPAPAPSEPGSDDWSSDGGGQLWTWAIPVNPIEQPLPLVCDAERLPDHRRAYLDYEGPISGNRGQVQRVASGSYEVVSWSEERIELRVQCSDAAEAGHEQPFLVLLNRQDEVWSLSWSAVVEPRLSPKRLN